MRGDLPLFAVFLEGLLQEGFDAKVFASSAIQSQAVGETLAKLSNGIALLDKELYTQVVSNYEDLLSQATGIEALESKFQCRNSLITFCAESAFLRLAYEYYSTTSSLAYMSTTVL